MPGESVVPVSGKVIGPEDICSVVDSALDGWFTTGRFAKEFERRLAKFVGVRSASLVNSGSSANLVALSALTSPKLGARQLKPGDEVTLLGREGDVSLDAQQIARTAGTISYNVLASIGARVKRFYVD